MLCAIASSQHLFEDDEQDEVDRISKRIAARASSEVSEQPKQSPVPAVLLKRALPADRAASKQAASEQKQPKQAKVQELVPVRVDADGIARAKSALRTRFNEMEVEIGETLVEAALVGLGALESTADSLKAALQQRGQVH